MPKEQSKLDPSIVAALIGLAGVVITALISSPLLMTWLQRAPAPSPTAQTTSLTPPARATETVAAFTPLPTLAPGEDFQNECIASGTWQLYPAGTFTPDAQGCWELSSWGMSAQPKGLVLLLTSPQSDQTHALATHLGKKVEVGFTLQIDSLSTAFDQVGNLAVGVVPESDPSPSKGLFLLWQVESSQQNAPIYLKIRDQGTESSVGNNTKYRAGEPHRLTFRLEDISLNILLDNDQIAGPFNVPATRSFWIGYTVPSGGNLSAVVSNLSIQSR
jgi:hypothetical protein